MQFDPVILAQALIRCRSVTPDHNQSGDGGAVALVGEWLAALGFTVRRLDFGRTPNLYARLDTSGPGSSGPNLCFAGHTDVVPAGEDWARDPFAGTIEDGVLYGRGAVDMKGAIAAFVAAVSNFLQSKKPAGSISLLITGDEEGEGLDGTERVLAALVESGETIDACIVGEPTGVERVGDTIKNGRRGSLNGALTVRGRQGHVAYPHMADNPIDRLAAIITAMKQPLDGGTDDFQTSNLEIVSIAGGTGAVNVIPGAVSLGFNIRFNTLHTPDTLAILLEERLKPVAGDYELCLKPSRALPFGTPPGAFTALLQNAVVAETGIDARLSTSGGTSDARFIARCCANTVELGLTNATMHKADECVSISDLETLSRIYGRVLRSYLT